MEAMERDFVKNKPIDKVSSLRKTNEIITLLNFFICDYHNFRQSEKLRGIRFRPNPNNRSSLPARLPVRHIHEIVAPTPRCFQLQSQAHGPEICNMVNQNTLIGIFH